MAAKQTPKKPAAKPAVVKTISKVSVPRLRAAWVLSGLAYTAVVVVLAVGIMRANGWQHEASGTNPGTTASAEPVPLAQNTMQVHACSDSIASIGSYTYSAHYFFDLKQAGFRLTDTLSQQAADGRAFTDADCAKYFAVRAAHPASDIMLQLFTTDASGNPLPYQYKDLKPSTCYSSDTTHRTVCPHAPSYGIFVKD